jgi:hypothetical protein
MIPVANNGLGAQAPLGLSVTNEQLDLLANEVAKKLMKEQQQQLSVPRQYSVGLLSSLFSDFRQRLGSFFEPAELPIGVALVYPPSNIGGSLALSGGTGTSSDLSDVDESLARAPLAGESLVSSDIGMNVINTNVGDRLGSTSPEDEEKTPLITKSLMEGLHFNETLKIFYNATDSIKTSVCKNVVDFNWVNGKLSKLRSQYTQDKKFNICRIGFFPLMLNEGKDSIKEKKNLFYFEERKNIDKSSYNGDLPIYIKYQSSDSLLNCRIAALKGSSKWTLFLESFGNPFLQVDAEDSSLENCITFNVIEEGKEETDKIAVAAFDYKNDAILTEKKSGQWLECYQVNNEKVKKKIRKMGGLLSSKSLKFLRIVSEKISDKETQIFFGFKKEKLSTGVWVNHYLQKEIVCTFGVRIDRGYDAKNAVFGKITKKFGEGALPQISVSYGENKIEVAPPSNLASDLVYGNIKAVFGFDEIQRALGFNCLAEPLTVKYDGSSSQVHVHMSALEFDKSIRQVQKKE